MSSRKLWLVGAMVALLWCGGTTHAQRGDRDKNAGQMPLQLENQLKAQFARSDRNKDGALDKEELAKTFRGPAAKPLPDNTDADPKKPARPPTADQLFLQTFDADKDGKVTFDEYKSGMAGVVEEFLDQQKQLEEQQHKLLEAQRKLSGGKLGKNERGDLEKQIREQQQMIERQQKQIQDLIRKQQDARRKNGGNK